VVDKLLADAIQYVAIMIVLVGVLGYVAHLVVGAQLVECL
jgi:hypothetical protein